VRAITPSGEGIEVVSRVRLTDCQVRRARAMQMLAMRRSGHAVRASALYFRVTERHVRREIASTPAWVKERVDAVLV
jgi:hypothetical protein